MVLFILNISIHVFASKSSKYSNILYSIVKIIFFLLLSQVGGYTQVYEGDLTFATVREAGHQVPSYQPARAFSLIKHFLEGKPLLGISRYN